jgi:hypothetical protein
MGEHTPGIAGDPRDPIAYLKEFLKGEISYNPKTLAEAYLNLAEQSDGSAQLAYSALAWAVNAQNQSGFAHLLKEIQQLEERVKTLEQRQAN